MKTIDLINGIKDILEIEDQVVELDTPLHISSLGTLSLIVFIDENFDKQFKASELREVNTIGDLVKLIGKEYFV